MDRFTDYIAGLAKSELQRGSYSDRALRIVWGQ
jgi:hypothetical protein